MPDTPLVSSAAFGGVALVSSQGVSCAFAAVVCCCSLTSAPLVSLKAKASLALRPFIAAEQPGDRARRWVQQERGATSVYSARGMNHPSRVGRV